MIQITQPLEFKSLWTFENDSLLQNLNPPKYFWKSGYSSPKTYSQQLTQYHVVLKIFIYHFALKMGFINKSLLFASKKLVFARFAAMKYHTRFFLRWYWLLRILIKPSLDWNKTINIWQYAVNVKSEMVRSGASHHLRYTRFEFLL